MSDKSIVRNAQYRRGGLSVRQRHNERQNADYMNDDIIKERAAYNVHFKQTEGSYEQMFDKLLADKTISTRGLGKDPFIVDEFVFDVNTAYFENHGGYDYAKSFFEEAYRCAVNEIGGEQYVLSAVMHADERHKALSEQLGRDVYHYHLHVVYVPVVDKEIYFKKNNKDPEKAGKLKEVIKQVSHSKKWPKLKEFCENGEVKRNAKGKAILVNSYSQLQDRFHDHMKQAGFTGFERGERGSTAEHLSVLEFKSKMESERANKETERAENEAQRAEEESQKAAAITAEVERKQQAAATLDTAIKGKEKTAANLDQKTEKKQKQYDSLDKKTAIKKAETATFAEIDGMAKPTLLGLNLQISPADWKTVSSLAKEGVKSRSIIADLKNKVSNFIKQITGYKQRLEKFEGGGITDKMRYFEAKARSPRRLAEIVADIMRKPPEKQEHEQQRTAPQQKRSTGSDR